MTQSIGEIEVTGFKTAAPVVLTIPGIPLTFSIAEGIGFGLISAAMLALALGEPRRMTLVGYAAGSSSCRHFE